MLMYDKTDDQPILSQILFSFQLSVFQLYISLKRAVWFWFFIIYVFICLMGIIELSGKTVSQKITAMLNAGIYLYFTLFHKIVINLTYLLWFYSTYM